jgi:hypothetical protein
MNSQHPLPILQGQVTQRLYVLNSSITDEDIDTSPLLGTLAKCLLNLCFIAHIHGNRHG